MLRVSEDGNRRHDGSIAKYRQMRQSLLDLQAAADRIFDTISQRAAEEREKLMNISTRIQKAKGDIAAISSSKQSLIIKSSSTYPSKSSDEVDFRPLFSYRDESSGAGFPVGKLLVNGGLNREFGADGTLELFQFFSETALDSPPQEAHTKSCDGENRSKGNAFSEYFGEPPSIPNSSFLMETNTSAEASVKLKQQTLPPPPPSLLPNNLRSLPRQESLGFKPSLNQVQSLKLPDIIPDLPTVSDTAFGGFHGHELEHKMDAKVGSNQVQSPMLPSPPPLKPSLDMPFQDQPSSSSSASKITQS